MTAHEENISLDEEASIALFRITQESLTNIAKHAKASKVEIVLTRQDKELLLLISDDGQGLSVESKIKKGVQLLVRIPL